MSQVMLFFRIAPWVAVLVLMAYAGRLDDLRERWHNMYLSEKSARVSDRNAYTATQNEARRMNEAEVARIESEQRRITDEVQSDLSARLERLRRELRKAPSSAGGSAGGPDSGPDGSAPEGAPSAPRLCLAPEELLRGAENEERHEQLIRWVEKQLGVKR
jgi:hypothetical protein